MFSNLICSEGGHYAESKKKAKGVMGTCTRGGIISDNTRTLFQCQSFSWTLFLLPDRSPGVWHTQLAISKTRTSRPSNL